MKAIVFRVIVVPTDFNRLIAGRPGGLPRILLRTAVVEVLLIVGTVEVKRSSLSCLLEFFIF